MKLIFYKNCELFFVLSFLFFCCNLFADVIIQDFFQSSINWTKLQLNIPIKEKIPKIQVNGNFETSSKFANNISEARTFALNSAKEKISLLFVRKLEQLQFDNRYKLIDLVNNSLQFRKSFNEFILNENLEYKVRIHEDEVHVEAIVYFLGKNGILNHLLQEYNTEELPKISDENFASAYTGLILDARHLEAKPALFPKILTENGLEIYSSKLVYKTLAIDNGYVKYYDKIEEAVKDKKIGDKPYILLAQSVLGKNKTDFSIPTQEAKKILAHKQTRENLKRCAVIILISEVNN